MSQKGKSSETNLQSVVKPADGAIPVKEACIPEHDGLLVVNVVYGVNVVKAVNGVKVVHVVDVVYVVDVVNVVDVAKPVYGAKPVN